MSSSGHGGNTQQEDFFIFVPTEINTNVVLVFKFANIFYVYGVLDSRYV